MVHAVKLHMKRVLHARLFKTILKLKRIIHVIYKYYFTQWLLIAIHVYVNFEYIAKFVRIVTFVNSKIREDKKRYKCANWKSYTIIFFKCSMHHLLHIFFNICKMICIIKCVLLRLRTRRVFTFFQYGFTIRLALFGDKI